MITAWEEDAYPLARRLAEQEGVFVGMSSGANTWASLQVARELGEGKRVATIACDTGARYRRHAEPSPITSPPAPRLAW